MNIKQVFEQLISGKHLSTSQMQEIIKDCMEGQLQDIQIAAFLALMRMKGETAEELTAAAHVMQQFAHSIDLGNDLIDIVGTGGDGRNTFNVSTVSSFVAAAAGVPVAKHGNHSVSSRSGSADLLLQAGFKLNLSDNGLKRCMQECGIAFLFAPHFHQALKHARHARQQLGIRTLFNLLGPLLNPARVKKQVVGVYAHHWLKPTANVLANLGSEHTLVIHSQDHLDEISICAITDVVEYVHGEFKEWSIDPKKYHCAHASLDDIVIETPAQSLTLAESVFAGEPGPARDIILLNSAAALYCANHCPTYEEAIHKAAEAIDSGLAYKRFMQLKALTQCDNNHE
ncbi:anthranilate phosphoribosyltransferase [Legionella nagasakiensis]|uniref:anthranilate phosphoribosyltransferase n=1 Tax=Legionella nagasakiensis TaxID=535290 RepID=UPI0010546DC7|nr:anthranilate phosphoribosyltransferase [Legionella nagasakiensis]